MKTESPYREQLRLRREITFRSARVHALEDAARSERVHLGLRKLAKKQCKAEIDAVNHICVSGRFDHLKESWGLGKAFDMEGNHGIITAQINNLSVTIQADDSKLLFTIAWPIEDRVGAIAEARAPLRLAANIKLVKRFFKRYGIAVDCNSIKVKRDEKLRDLDEMNALINVVSEA